MTSTSVDRIYGLSSGVAVKAPVRVATTAAITLSGLQTIDGVTLVADDRVLVKNQVDTTTNGIYVASTSTWQRDQDFDGGRDIVQGTIVFVNSGTVSAQLFYRVTTANPITVGTSSLVFAVGSPIISPVPIASGGTGSSTAATARTALGFGTSLTANLTKAPTRTLLGTPGTATYTTPTGATRLSIRMVGGGGGSGGSGGSGVGAGGTGGTTSFGSSLSCTGGVGSGANTAAGGVGGSPTGGDIGFVGAKGSSGSTSSGNTEPGGDGGQSPFGGRGAGGTAGAGGNAPAGSTGSGAGGPGGTGGAVAVGGGGAGAYLESVISGPAATYSYTIGSGGTAGAVGSTGSAGAAGSAGYIIVDEYYN